MPSSCETGGPGNVRKATGTLDHPGQTAASRASERQALRVHEPLCPSAAAVFAECSKARRTQGAAQSQRGSRYNFGAGSSDTHRTGTAVSPGISEGKRVVEGGRDLLPRRRQVTY